MDAHTATPPAQYAELANVKHRVTLGAPLPFNVRDADGTLLLARGRVLRSREQMELLFERGALVDLDELLTAADHVRLAHRHQLPDLWQSSFQALGDVLHHTDHTQLRAALDSCAEPVLQLVERDPDLAIFQVLRQEGGYLVRCGVDHSMHAAIAAVLMARRLGWDEADAERAFKAALTMNLSMLELQGQLARQAEGPSPEQREAILAHPEISVRMLRLAGVEDAAWLDAVAQHHERPDGQGYPRRLTQVSELAAVLQRADRYAAKLSRRANRPALPADQAVRAMYSEDSQHPVTAALVKEFGIYPPGCFVRLVNGETGVVLQRGPTVQSPKVAVLAQADGQFLPRPIRRDTAVRGFAVQATLAAHPALARVSPQDLVALMD